MTGFPPVQYMFEGTNFTTRCVIQVDDAIRSTYAINVYFLYMNCNNTSDLFVIYNSPRTHVEVDYADNWIVTAMTINNVTIYDSGCYGCLAVSFGYTKTDYSNITFVKGM